MIWGGPGNQLLQAASWSDTQVTFMLPVKNSSGIQMTPGVIGTVSVTNDALLSSNSANLAINSAVKWPVSFNSGVTTIGNTGNGFVQTTGSIDQAGNLTANTQVWDTSAWGVLTGFHAVTIVRLYGTFGNVIDTSRQGRVAYRAAKTSPIPGRPRPLYASSFTQWLLSTSTTPRGPHPGR